MPTTLIMANQYSKLPNVPTARPLTYSKAHENARIHSHCGRLGKPPLAIDGDGDGLAAGGDALRRPIGVADGEAGPAV